VLRGLGKALWSKGVPEAVILAMFHAKKGKKRLVES